MSYAYVSLSQNWTGFVWISSSFVIWPQISSCTIMPARTLLNPKLNYVPILTLQKSWTSNLRTRFDSNASNISSGCHFKTANHERKCVWWKKVALLAVAATLLDKFYCWIHCIKGLLIRQLCSDWKVWCSIIFSLLSACHSWDKKFFESCPNYQLIKICIMSKCALCI